MSKAFLSLLLAISLTASAANADVKEGVFANAKQLIVTGWLGRLRIEPDTQPGIHVRLEGPKETLDAIVMQEQSGVLRINGLSNPGGSVSVINTTNAGASNSISSVTIGANVYSNIVISGPDGSLSTVIGGNNGDIETVVQVPEEATVIIEQALGDITVGDTHGPVKIDMSAGNAKLGMIGNAELRVDGTGSINARRVVGDLTVQVQGTGKVEVADAELDQLTVAVEGTGKVIVGGQAQRADLAVQGVGRIEVVAVVERPRLSVQGLGRIEVGNW